MINRNDIAENEVKCGWSGNNRQFIDLSYQEFEKALTAFVYRHEKFGNERERIDKTAPQIRAWEDSFAKLKSILEDFIEIEGAIIFEYEIPRTGGRRPDVLLILPGNLLVIECKSYTNENESYQAESAQVSTYVRDLRNYHSVVSRANISIQGVLFLTNDKTEDYEKRYDFEIYITSINCLGNFIHTVMKKEKERREKNNEGDLLALDDFLNGVYSPLPSVLEAARMIFNNQELPRLKMVESSNFNYAFDKIVSIIKKAKELNEHYLVLVSGEPGSGKTFLGLKIAHDIDKAVYLSGNDPLVDVLLDTLLEKKNNPLGLIDVTLVQKLRSFKKEYAIEGEPDENVFVFDEGQRAWDEQKVRKHRSEYGLKSEPDLMIEIAKRKSWSVVIGLIGTGQEIYAGEEGGIELWNKGISGQEINVYTAEDERIFSNAKVYIQEEHLYLDSSLRSHQSKEYHVFVNALLDKKISLAKKKLKSLKSQRYHIFLTRELRKAKDYSVKRYEDESDKRMGLVCSSQAKIHEELKLPNIKSKYEKISHVCYFNDPESCYFGNKLKYAATEFQIQGLELDHVIICWDIDLLWNGKGWIYEGQKAGVKNQRQLGLNTYRVLLTRGRDGVIIYIPQDKLLDQTYEFLKNEIGIPLL